MIGYWIIGMTGMNISQKRIEANFGYILLIA